MRSSGLSNSGRMQRCAWCGEDEKPLTPREKVCTACLRTRKYAASMRKKLEAIPSAATDHERWEQKRELRIAEKMVEICQGDGQLMETILNGEIFDAVDLEGTLTSVAYAVCHQTQLFPRYCVAVSFSLYTGTEADIGLSVVEAQTGGSKAATEADGYALSAFGRPQTG